MTVFNESLGVIHAISSKSEFLKIPKIFTPLLPSSVKDKSHYKIILRNKILHYSQIN